MHIACIIFFTVIDPGPFTICKNGDRQKVNGWLENPKTDINVTNSKGETPLHEVCRRGQTEILELLLQHEKIDVNHKSHEGMTPLHIASQMGHPEIAQFLLRRKDLRRNEPDSQGLTPLCYAEKCDMVNLLLERFCHWVMCYRNVG